MDAQSSEKRGRGRPRKNPPPTIVAKSTIIRRTVPTDNDGTGTEVLHSSIDFVGDNVVPIVRSALTTDASGTPGAGAASAAAAAAAPASGAGTGSGAGAAAAANQAPAAADGAAASQPRKRGRPPKAKPADGAQDAGASRSAPPVLRANDGEDAPAPKRRGRPPKVQPAEPVTEAAAEASGSYEDAMRPVPLVRRVRPAEAAAAFPVVSEGARPVGFKGPGVRLGKEVQVGDSKLSFFYIVFKNQEHDELLYPDTMHSIQHLLSAAAKEADLPNIVKIMPCGSRTAMEVAVLDAQSDFSKHELRKLMLTAAYMDNIPADELQRCSNPGYQNFTDAHREICEFIDTMYGITLDSRSGDYSW